MPICTYLIIKSDPSIPPTFKGDMKYNSAILSFPFLSLFSILPFLTSHYIPNLCCFAFLLSFLAILGGGANGGQSKGKFTG
jgi:hypothetical protein